MNTLPAKMADSLSLIRTFATFPSSHLGSSNYGIVSFLQRNRGSRVSFLKTDWSLEKCCMRVENCLQALRPASEAFAQEATDALKAGKVIAVPTDTLYGLACDACTNKVLGERSWSGVHVSRSLPWLGSHLGGRWWVVGGDEEQHREVILFSSVTEDIKPWLRKA
ncbi:hypothetical protein IC582_028066 [Cucumis melo]